MEHHGNPFPRLEIQGAFKLEWVRLPPPAPLREQLTGLTILH
jgi:hypothetical protein